MAIRRFMLPIIVILMVAGLSLAESPAADSQQDDAHIGVPAFPGAMGGGMYTTGGRGGKVIKVTNLNDKGPGSLREAIETSGSRTVLFDVSGTIELKSQLLIENGDLTIAGQSAPGDGICIKGHEVRLNADNIIIRYIRFRPGDISNKEYDALTGMRNKNIIIDHCSMSWSTDETVSLYDNQNFTLQWCLISESLNNSVHSKGAHGYGGIWGGKNASFLFNILAHHNSRNPRLQGTRYQVEEGREKAELINNVIYNWGDKAIYGGEHGNYNIINNVFIPGPATNPANRDEILEPYDPPGKFFIQGNTIFLDAENEQTVGWDYVTVPRQNIEPYKADKPFTMNVKTPIACTRDAYRLASDHAGASLVRDAVDIRIIEEIRQRSFTYGNSGIIDSQQQVDGWPQLATGIALKDSDGDGIPDEWEIKYGLNPRDASDAKMYSLDNKYTNLEVFLNHQLPTP